MTRRVLPALAAALSVAAGGAPAQEPVAFPVGTARVAVDVSVVDSRGRPVADLRPEDFELRVDGRPRAIATIEFVRQGGGRGEPPPTPGYVTNEGGERGRLVVIAVDQGSLRSGLVRDVTLAADWLLDALTPADRVGLVAFPPPGPSVELTADHLALRQALGRVAGRLTAQLTRLGLVEALALDDNPLVWQAALARECPPELDQGDATVCVADLENEALQFANDYRMRAETARRTLEALFGALAAVEGPKSVVLLSQGLDSGMPGDLPALGRAAAAARVSLFVLRLDRDRDDAGIGRPSPTPVEDRERLTRGLDGLAAAARGTVFHVAAGAEGAFARVADELSGYYLLGFEPEDAERDGKDHDIRVEVRPRGLTVRSRASVRIETAEGAAKAGDALVSALRSPLPVLDVGLRAAVYSLPSPKADAVRVVIAAQRPEDASDTALFGFALLGPKGELVASGQRSVGERGATLAADVLAGPYVLRVAVVDGRGRRGSLEAPVEARLEAAGGVALGDLVLLDAERGTPLVVPEPLPDGRLAASVELDARGGLPLDGVSVSFEVADDAEAPALVGARGRLQPKADGGGQAAQATFALGVLPPGDYVARAVVSRGGDVIGRVVRPVRIPPRAPRTAAGPAPEPGRIRAAEVQAFLPRFDAREALDPGLLRYVLDRVDALAPSARPDVQGGIDLLAAGRPEVARARLKEAVARHSELVVVAILIGACEAALGEDRQAVGAWRTALITEPEAPLVRRLAADALVRVDEPAEAAALLDEERQRRPGPDLERRRALALAQAGRATDALPLLEAVLEKDPADLAALYLVLRLAFDEYARGEGKSPFARDPERLERYARSYVAAKGPQQEVVARWLRFLEKR